MVINFKDEMKDKSKNAKKKEGLMGMKFMQKGMKADREKGKKQADMILDQIKGLKQANISDSEEEESVDEAKVKKFGDIVK